MKYNIPGTDGYSIVECYHGRPVGNGKTQRILADPEPNKKTLPSQFHIAIPHVLVLPHQLQYVRMVAFQDHPGGTRPSHAKHPDKWERFTYFCGNFIINIPVPVGKIV